MTKALRQSGFPEIEAKTLPSTACNKVMTGIQKRLVKLDETLGKISELQPAPESLLEKTLVISSVVHERFVLSIL